jgi:DNA mismatch repair protein MutS
MPQTAAARPPTDTPAETGAGAVTPMMAQYLEIKAEHADCLLFYRMGDFYELFFDDAEQAAQALDIALTKRGKHLGADIPMCGVPAHSHESYLQRLIAKGFRVAVCEQAESPEAAKKRGSKAVVRREVVRVVTPGTITEDSLLDARENNYLASCVDIRGETGLAWIDVSTGAFYTQSIDPKRISSALTRLNPSEILVSETFVTDPSRFDWLGDWRDRLRVEPDARFDSVNALRRLKDHYDIESLDGYGAFSTPEIAAAGAVLDYVILTQKGRAPRLAAPRPVAQAAVMDIDGASARNLELLRCLDGRRAGSLLSVIDRTLTGPGGRLLAQRLAAPLTDPAAIDARLDAVQFFADADSLRERVRAVLAHAPDIERAVARIGLERGGPRDLIAVREGARAAQALRALIEDDAATGRPAALDPDLADLGRHDTVIDRLDRALADDAPMLARDGGFIRADYLPALDEARTLRDESRRLIAGLQADYAAETGVSALKIRHNNVLGYFIEVPAKQADKIPVAAGSRYIHRQTMANAVRFSTVDLGDLESRIAKAADRALALEMEAFKDLCAEVLARADALGRAARALAALDVAQGLADVARRRSYVRPRVDAGLAFDVRAGRHPVVEAALDRAGETFVANDCRLGAPGDDDTESGTEPGTRLWLLTGPNMAGKSTFLRQNALIAVLAQTGSFVPAAAAHIGVVDRLFSRVGAADDLARGRSTFMVEMVETAAILNLATERSLVILDEIGRGTATYDGLSIAWAVVEHLHEKNASRALFATHYHELTRLADRLEALSCHTMRVKEWKGDVVFLHEVGPGAADRSYGIHVGRLAGLPDAVVARADAVLKTLEAGPQAAAVDRLADDLPLFSFEAKADAAASPGSAADPAAQAVHQAISTLNLDRLTPLEALQTLYDLKAKASDPGPDPDADSGR